MGLLALQRLMSLQGDRQRRQLKIGSLNSPIASVDKRKVLSYEQDGHVDSQASKRMMCSIPTLPEDILHHIHSLLSLCDAARAACLSRAFLRSWRCRPILALNRNILGSNKNAPQKNFSCIIDIILRSHTGIGIKILKLELHGIFYACHYLDSWLQITVTPGIEELTLKLCNGDEIKHNVPCTLFSPGVRNSIQYLQLFYCAFHPTAELGPLRNLTSLHLYSVHILGDELECFLSNSSALKQLYLSTCQEIMSLKIPCVLQQLNCVNVSYCWNLRVIENKARNVSSFILLLQEGVKVSLGETLQMKNLSMGLSNIICYARSELPSNMPNLETLSISSHYERVDTPMLPTKFVSLKCLAISLRTASCPSYDYFSLVSFLDASPSLETWSLDVAEESTEHESIFGGSSELRQMPEQNHACLKSLKIKGFNSTKGLVELTCYVLKNTASLDCLTLDTAYGDPKCDNEMSGGRCAAMNKDFLMKARRGAAAIRTYIEDKVPPTVKLTVVEHCRRCHADVLSAQ
ncbi:hypothetical protein BS78_09G201200 [Paspalum vaginatum]|nr:hypothetical protein BS78_09G201200 [Paspalum vaginatum]